MGVPTLVYELDVSCRILIVPEGEAGRQGIDVCRGDAYRTGGASRNTRPSVFGLRDEIQAPW